MKLSIAANLLNVDLSPSFGSIVFTGVSSDTRTIQPNDLFVAISGPHFDGHHFIAQAAEKKAAAIMIDRACDTTLPYLRVDNTIKAMGILAAAHRAQFNIPIIGVTGSCGKTSTRALIASILSECAPTLFSESSFNNHIGVPLTVLRLNAQHQYAVIEIGANHFGEIADLTHIVKPDVALIINAAEAHLDGFGDVAGVCKAKGEIFQGLAPNGIAILNADDPHLTDWEAMIAAQFSLGSTENVEAKKPTILRFSLSKPVDVYAQEISLNTDNTSQFILVTPQGKTRIHLPLLGRHNISNALAAAAAAFAVHIPLNAIQAGLEKVSAVQKRLNIHEIGDDIYLIDDSYNANPLSVMAAIDTLATQSGKKILVLGDMKELGEQTEAAHFQIGEKAKQAGVDLLLTYGDASQFCANGFGDQAKHFTDQAALIALLKTRLVSPMNILIKGSRSMEMEKIVAALNPIPQFLPPTIKNII